MVVAAIWRNFREDNRQGIADFFRGLLDAGLDLNMEIDQSASGQQQTIGALLANFFSAIGSADLLFELRDQGVLRKLGQSNLDAMFSGSMGCKPAIAKMLVDAGANPKAKSESGNALHKVRGSYSACRDAGKGATLEMARALIALGVPLEDTDDNDWTPLMGTDDPDLARMLLDAGANANAKSKDGTTPLLSIDDDRVAIILLRAGADPRAKDDSGSVRDQAKKHDWPATLKWLDALGIK